MRPILIGLKTHRGGWGYASDRWHPMVGKAHASGYSEHRMDGVYYNGGTNIADFALLAGNFNRSVPAPVASVARGRIPEPTVVLITTLLSVSGCSACTARAEQTQDLQ